MSTFYAMYPPSSASSNASVGTNGAPAPSSSTEVAGINPGGNLQPLQTDAQGNLLVSVNASPASPYHVIVDSSALPTGASTSALQTTGNTSVASIDTKTPALGQALAAASVPVVLTAAQVSTLTPLTSVTVTQATGTNLHTVVDSSALPTGAATSANQTNASQKTQIVDGSGNVIAATSNALNVNISSGSSGLPTGAATSALQTTGNTSVASIDTKTPALGQTNMAGSRPVTIASDQALSTGMLRSATGNFTSTGSTAVTISPSGASAIMFQLSGTFSATMTFEWSADNGTTWTALVCWDQGNTTLSSTGNVSGRGYVGPALGNLVRARCSTYASGTVVCTIIAGLGFSPATYVSPVSFFPIQGNVAKGSTATGTNPVLVGGIFQTSPSTLSDGQQAYLQTDSKQNLYTNEIAAATATLTNVNGSASSVSLLASNTARKNATFFNDSTAVLYLKFGATASTTSYTVQIPSNGYYELPNGKVYNGAIDGIWAAANGAVRITELS